MPYAWLKRPLVNLAMCLGLSYAVVGSTAEAGWVSHLQLAFAVPVVSVPAAIGLGSIRRLPIWISMPVLLLAGVLCCAGLTWPTFASLHPTDPSGGAWVQLWADRVGSGAAWADPGFFLFITVFGTWLTAAWLALWVQHSGKALIGLVPSVAIVSANVLNFPDNQDGYVLAVVALSPALMLWTTYGALQRRAASMRMSVQPGSRWDFWEAGVAAAVALVVLGLFAPPMSTVDQSITSTSSTIQGWANFQQLLGRQVPLGQAVTNSTGFSANVGLDRTLRQDQTLVFAYRVLGTYKGPLYFRGVNEIDTSLGSWQPGDITSRLTFDPGSSIPADVLSASVGGTETADISIDMFRPPVRPDSDLIFYPGDSLAKIDRTVVVATSSFNNESPDFATDRVEGLTSGSGLYNETVRYSVATQSQLEAAGEAYPSTMDSYRTFNAAGYRPPDVMARIHALALRITAGRTNPYDKADAIQAYLRSSPFKYSLSLPPLPAGADPIDDFLFHSHTGYCQYFATAMGDLLRSLGIPVRLVSGFGPGTYYQNQFVVRDSDAHIWVEVYFPGYGWEPFEPTAIGK